MTSVSVSAQDVEEVIKKYNNSIDPNNKLDSITHLSVDAYQRIESPVNQVFIEDTTTSIYSIFGENSLANHSDGEKVDLNMLIKPMSWEVKNIIRNHLNMLIKKDDESFELLEANDSTFVVKKQTPIKTELFEIDKASNDLRKKTIKGQSQTIIMRYFEYQLVDGIKVVTKLSFENEVATAEVVKFNYKFWKAVGEVED